MQLSEIKLIAKSFFYYGKGFSYIYMRYIVAPNIFKGGRAIKQPTKRDDVTMHMLFGARDFQMAVWSLASFYRVMPVVGELVIHSDGSLTETHCTKLKKLFPDSRIENSSSFLNAHSAELATYPILKKFREEYKKFQCKKLIDQCVLSGKPIRILLDSDMLWFREPKEITESLMHGVPTPLMMTNQDDLVPVEFADGTKTSDKVARANSGIVVYREEQFQLKEVEKYVSKTDYMNKKFTDQACFATVLEPLLLSERTYIIKGTLTDSVILRHYTSPSRAKFFFYGLNFIWKDILENYVRD